MEEILRNKENNFEFLKIKLGCETTEQDIKDANNDPNKRLVFCVDSGYNIFLGDRLHQDIRHLNGLEDTIDGTFIDEDFYSYSYDIDNMKKALGIKDQKDWRRFKNMVESKIKDWLGKI